MPCEFPRIEASTRIGSSEDVEIDKARLTVARHAMSLDDCYDLLDMLGLLPRKQEPEPESGGAAEATPGAAKPHRFMFRVPRRAN